MWRMSGISLLCVVGLMLWRPASASATERLVTAGGTLTDIVFALQAGDRVVAVDVSSTSPAAAAALPKVGYYRDLAAEGVLSFAPTELWVLEGSGSDQVLQQIAATGVKLRHFAKPHNFKELQLLIQQVAAALDIPERGRQLNQQLREQLPSVAASRGQSALFVMQASERGVIAAGGDSVPDLLMHYAGLHNLAEHQGFKTISREYLAVMQPNYLIAPAHVVQMAGGEQAFCQQPALSLLSAAKQCRLVVLDSLLALGMTTRFSEAVALLKQAVTKANLVQVN
ncbi:heme/hemin ABC transporter substrate-binding protein [Idiomarina xiamenensis]|uniref:Hemin ABC transporter substrate-binding protein n=1 Tax=Idiomarina xiamenensis 10-D-4 TaxID=740709 RepID=K2KYS1_9GAMM|nr:ABC transporter substrate-binding protein [Idiomarina xiamenensis]EKE87664.1 hemin ABC transporter substrate-binding protein [Idiomarina xiamenensis 10-D-4]